MARRIIMCLIGVALVTGLVAGVVTAATAGITEAERTTAIHDGLAWLSTAQTPGGYFEDPANPGYFPVALTAFAVLKFEDDAARNGMSPFDSNYEYYTVVQKAWQYLSQNAHAKQPLSLQPQGDPDTNGDHIGVYFYSPNDASKEVYETGIVMMALQAGRASSMVVPGFAIPGVSSTFRDVLQECVDWVAWAQTDSGSGEGGWCYTAMDNDSGWSDNSASQWPVLGLMAAEVWNISAPAWVKNELLNHWLAATQQTSNMQKPGCFGYTEANNATDGGYFATTAAGLVELTYCGVLSNAPQWQAGAQCICQEWDALPNVGNIGNLYAMYGLMRAAMLARPVPVWTFCEHEWQPEYDRWLVDKQTKFGVNAGSWPAGYALPWYTWDKCPNAVLSTEYALLILQKTVPGVYDPLASLEDLLRHQADRLTSFESLLKVCWRNLEREQQLEFLRSFEDLLHSQADRLESFEDLLNAAIGELGAAQQVVFLRSFEDLLRRQAQAVASFEDLLKAYNAAVQPALQMFVEKE